MSIPIILRQRAMLDKWKFIQPPQFSDVPPKDDPERLNCLFTGRQREIDRVIPLLLGGSNVLVRGAWGIGKTAFILQVLHEVSYQTGLISESVLPIYIDNFRGGSLPEFYRLILFALASSLSDSDSEARAILEAMRGVSISHKRAKSIRGKVDLNLLTVVNPGVEAGADSDTQHQFSVSNPEYWVDELLSRAHQRFQHVIIAVDDLDKTDPVPVEFIKVGAMFDGALPLLRNDKCAFILTGRTTSVAQDVYAKVLGIFHNQGQLQLPRLSPGELREITIKTLNLARYDPRNDPYPFTDDALDQVIEKSDGIPRQMNRNCDDLLHAAVRLEIEKLDADGFARCFAEVQSLVSEDIDTQMRQLLYIAQKHGGFSQSNRKALDELGWGDFIEVLPVLEDLVRRDLLLRQDYAEGIRFLVAPRAEKAALLEDGDRQ